MHSVRIPRDRERSVHAEHLTEASSFRSREALSSSRSVPSVPRTLRHRSLACAARRAVLPRPRAPGRTMSAGVGPGSLDVTMSLDATSGRDPSIEAASLGPRERNPSSDMPEASSTLLLVHPAASVLLWAPVTSSRRLPVRRRASAVSTIPGSTTLRASNLVSADVTHRSATRLAWSGQGAGRIAAGSAIGTPERASPPVRPISRGSASRSSDPLCPDPDAFVVVARPLEEWVFLAVHSPTRTAVDSSRSSVRSGAFHRLTRKARASLAPSPGEPGASTPL